ncbi:MAG: hypothetical protein EXR11_10270 [Rhodospirillaceae bacterium]|nr:hypothetical protein [Rhodospirillaceae bacterium]
MNPRRVIVWMTLAVFVLVGWLMITIFDGLPPWPVLICFTISHVFFCVVISRVQPYRGPYVEPINQRNAKDWSEG